MYTSDESESLEGEIVWWIFEVDAVFWDEVGDCCFGLCFEGVLANEEIQGFGADNFPNLLLQRGIDH